MKKNKRLSILTIKGNFSQRQFDSLGKIWENLQKGQSNDWTLPVLQLSEHGKIEIINLPAKPERCLLIIKGNFTQRQFDKMGQIWDDLQQGKKFKSLPAFQLSENGSLEIIKLPKFKNKKNKKNKD